MSDRLRVAAAVLVLTAGLAGGLYLHRLDRPVTHDLGASGTVITQDRYPWDDYAAIAATGVAVAVAIVVWPRRDRRPESS